MFNRHTESDVMRLQFVPRSGTQLDAQFGGHSFTLFFDCPELADYEPEGRWMLGVDGDIVSSFASLNQAKHAAERFADCRVWGPGLGAILER